MESSTLSRAETGAEPVEGGIEGITAEASKPQPAAEKDKAPTKYVVLYRNNEDPTYQWTAVPGDFEGTGQHDVKRKAATKLIEDGTLEEGNTFVLVAVPARSWQQEPVFLERPEPQVRIG